MKWSYNRPNLLRNCLISCSCSLTQHLLTSRCETPDLQHILSLSQASSATDFDAVVHRYLISLGAQEERSVLVYKHWTAQYGFSYYCDTLALCSEDMIITFSVQNCSIYTEKLIYLTYSVTASLFILLL